MDTRQTGIVRVLQVAPRYAPAWAFGGGVRISFDLGRGLAALGHHVSAYTSNQLDRTRVIDIDRERLEGVDITRFRNRFQRLAGAYPFAFFRPPGLKRALGRLGGAFDVVHVSEARGPHVHWAIEAARRQGVPVVWSPYGGLAEGEGSRRVYRRLYDRVFSTRETIRGASGLIATSSHEKDTLVRLGARPDRVRVIPLGVQWSDFETLPARGAFRRSIGLDDRAKVVLFVGRINAAKNVDMLIRAFARVHTHVGDARLVIVGNDFGHLDHLKAAVAELGIQSLVTFSGPIYGPDRLAMYADADAFAITPNIFEETTLSSLEAAACGTQCVLTRQCEIPGLEETGAGRTVECREETIAAALVEALQPGIPETRGARARSMVEARFTVKAIVKQHEDFFEEVVDATRHAAA